MKLTIFFGEHGYLCAIISPEPYTLWTLNLNPDSKLAPAKLLAKVLQQSHERMNIYHISWTLVHTSQGGFVPPIISTYVTTIRLHQI